MGSLKAGQNNRLTIARGIVPPTPARKEDKESRDEDGNEKTFTSNLQLLMHDIIFRNAYLKFLNKIMLFRRTHSVIVTDLVWES